MAPAFNLEFEVYCACGEGLCKSTKVGYTPGRGEAYIEVDPCEKCLKAARKEGRQEANT